MKKRVKYIIKGTDELGIGYLYKDRKYTGGYYILSGDKKARYSINLIKDIEKI